MTTKTLHFFGPLTLITAGGFVPNGIVTRYGQEVVINDDIRELNTDTEGVCWLDLANDERAQRRRWGRVLFAGGVWPNDRSRLEEGSDEWLEAAATARREAWKIENGPERAQRMRDIDAEFGPPPTTSRTLQAYGTLSTLGGRGDD